MSPVALPTRGPQCPPAVELEELAASDAPLPEHVAGCAQCSPYVAALKVEQAAWRKARPFEQLEAKLAQRAELAERRSSWWQWLVPVAVLAAALLSFWFRLPPSAPGIRVMGSELKGQVLRRGASEAAPLREDDLLQQGDRLRFDFTPQQGGEVLLFELDGRDVVTPVARGQVLAGSQLLPASGSWELTEPNGPEWFIAVVSPKPLDAAAIAAQLKGQATRPKVTVQCDDCRVYTVRFQADAPR